MTPRAFRALPALDQIEMMGHMQEVALRRAHGEHVAKVVSELKEPKDDKNKPPGRRGR